MAMAYSTLGSLANTLHYFAIEDKYHIFGDADDANRRPFQSLFDNVVFLRDFLEKFTGKARKLEAQIGESANEVECSIEYYISDMISAYGQLIDKDIDKLIIQISEPDARIESIVQEVKEMVMNVSTENTSSHHYLPSNSNEVHRKQVVVGFEDDLSKIVDRLFSNDSELVIIPIVGMGGIGKSTLAKAVFDDPAIIDRFDRHRWVTISHNFDIHATYLAILGEGSYDDSATISDLSVKVHQLLYRRKYLIVIDDIWSSDAWDGIRRVLPDNSNGSRVLLTTRDENVASYAVSSSYIHHLELMDEENGWNLFERLVFGEEHCPPELVSIGENIIEGCHGLPIAITIMSGILSNVKCTADAWKVIAEDVNGALSKGDEHFTEILSLSYYRLPTHLKPCFLYFGGFPEDYEIRVSDIIRYWIADGFLNVDRKANDLEQIAYEYFEDLVRRNLIIVINENITGNIKNCKIHDVLRAMCIRIAQEENFMHHHDDISEGKTRRVNFTSRIPSHTTMTPLSPIRVALCFQGVDDNSLLKYLKGFRLLRVLDVRCFALEKFSDQFFQLYHLRYLALRYKGREFHIPTEICQLENLEIFIVEPKGARVMPLDLPQEIWSISNLRILKIKNASMPPAVSKISGLKNLRKLSNALNLRFEQHLVELIPSVEKLNFSLVLNNELNETWTHCLLHNLEHLSHLVKLYICLANQHYDGEWCKKNPLLRSITFPYNLRRLTIFAYSPCISWEDVNNVIGSLPNLEVLDLMNMSIDCVWETKDGNFMKLRVLSILDNNLERWITESSSHFPSLEELDLGYCKRLIELPGCIGDIPTLTSISLSGYQPGVNKWATEIEEEQRDIGNDEFTIIRAGGHVEDILLEVIEPAEELLSTDELVEKLKLWAGDDEIKLKRAADAGSEYLMERFGRGEVGAIEIYLFQNAMGLL